MKHKVRKMMTWVMSFLMTLSIVPTAALADEAPETIDASPYTYVNKQQLIGNDTELNLSNLSTIADDLSSTWGPIAGAIFNANAAEGSKKNSRITVDYPSDDYVWDEAYGPERENGGGINRQKEDGFYVDVIDKLSGAHAKPDRSPDDGSDIPGSDTYNTDCSWMGGSNKDLTYMSSGLQYATSLTDVIREMCRMSSVGLRHVNGESTTHDEGLANAIYEAAGDHLSTLTSVDSTKVFYRIVTSTLKRNDDYWYNNYGLIFYDFTLAPILIGDNFWDKTPVETYGSDSGSGTNTQTSFYENKSQSESEVSAEISSETQDTVSNSMETTNSFAFSTELGIETKYSMSDVLDIFDLEQTISTKFGTEETVSTAWSNEKSLTNTIGGSNTASVTLPPHTCIALEQTTGKVSKTITYKCPVALNYKVAVVSLCGKFDDDLKADKTPDYGAKSLCVIFGSGDKEGGMYAPQNLYVRARKYENNSMEGPFGQVQGWYGNSHVTKLDWSKITNACSYGAGTGYKSTTESIDEAATQLPMFNAGASLTATQSTKKTELGTIQPLYRLTNIELAQGDKSTIMAVGDTLNMDSYAVAGKDSGGVPYYGFDPNDGTWVLCDKDGNELATSEFAELEADAAAGTLMLNAIAPGTVYLKWVLSDTASYLAKEDMATQEGQGDYVVTKENFKSENSPKIKVVINETPVNLNRIEVEAKGESTVFTNQELQLLNAFEATVYDDTDSVVSHTVSYELQDKSLPADITNNVFTATEAGDYQIRAVYTNNNPLNKQTIKSDWLTVHVHSLTKTDAVAATCTEDGNIDYWTDDQTGDLYADEDGTTSITKEEVVKPALGHDLEHVDAAEATCTKGGNIEHYLCKRCGKFFADEQAATELGEGDVIFTDALGHDWDEGVVDPGAGCVTTGTKTYTCQREGCGITKAEEVAALGHSWGDWIESRPATDTEDGEEKRMCIYCSAEETRTIPSFNHVHDLSKVDAVAPGCVTDGNIDYWLCSSCNNIYADDAAQTQINKGDEVVRATGHAWDEGTVTTDPTCTGAGIRTLTCTNQGCTATEEVEEPAHGHDMENAIESVLTEPTCTTPGRKKLACAYKDSESCTYYKTEAIDALDHAWDEGKVTTKPTCTTKGTKTYTCTREGCGQTKTEDIDAIGHEWGAWTKLNAKQHQRVCAHDAKHVQKADHAWDGGVVTKEATVKSKGTKTYTCADCGATKTESTPKLKITGTLLNKMVPKGKTGLAISWNKINGADGYDVFLAPCNGKGKTYTLEVVESNEDTSARSTVIKDLKKKTCYKACVKAFVNVDGEKVYVKSGVLIHCLTSGGTKTRTNPKSITVDKTKVTLAKGKSKQIKASVVKKDDSKKLLSESHSPSLRYKSSNRKVATVSKSGRILAKGKGTCKVYVIASNGARKAVTVRVK